MTVTAEQVRAAVEAAGIVIIDHHECGGCGWMTHYSVVDGRLYFNAGCHCTPQPSPPSPRDWSDPADWINRQTDEGVRTYLMLRFGLAP